MIIADFKTSLNALNFDKYPQLTKRVWVYRAKILVVDFNYKGFEFGYDLYQENLEYRLDLILRNKPAHEFIIDTHKIYKQVKNNIYTGVDDKLIETLKSSVNELITLIDNENVEEKLNRLLQSVNRISLAQEELRKEQNFYLKQISFSLQAKLREELYHYDKHNKIKLLETIKAVKDKRLSLARYGDGEINMMIFPEYSAKWQTCCPELTEKLENIIQYNGFDYNKLLVALPGARFKDDWWENYWPRIWPIFKNYLNLNLNVKYGDSFISRPEFFKLYKEEAIQAWKTVWEGEHICFITGEASRFDIEHCLFSNVASKRVIFSKNRDAYVDLPRIMKIIHSDYSKDNLYLIALGQAGTVLAAELAQKGYWALDIGHIDRSYENIFNNAPRPEQVLY